MSSERTLPEIELPWKGAAPAGRRAVMHLAIAWSLDEPERIGQVVPIEGEAMLGRGGMEFSQVRPGESRPAGPLRSGRISRQQLRLDGSGGSIQVENVGKCPLLFNGAQVQRALAKDGDVLVLKNALVLLAVERPRALQPLQAAAKPSFPFAQADAHGVVGESAAAWHLRDQLALAAASGHHVLLQGESGSGKELAARALHALSPRAKKPFIARNAATFPEGLVDAELFGSAKNYPNPGMAERPGLVGEADGGTLFLDEIGELPAAMQAHLLRLLDRGGEYQRLGESRMRTADLRVVAATNRPIDALKHDFAARFAARLRVPGLSERREDIPLLCRALLARLMEANPPLRRKFTAPAGEVRMEPALVEALLSRPFTLHLRELERLLWTAASSSRGDYLELTAEVRAELGAAPAAASDAGDVGADQVRAALQSANGSVTAAARALGLKNRFVLYRLMKRHGIEGG